MAALMTIADQALALWATYERIGIKPSMMMVVNALRAGHVSFRTESVREALRPLMVADPHPKARHVRGQPRVDSGLTKHAPGTDSGMTACQSSRRAPADHKGIIDSGYSHDRKITKTPLPMVVESVRARAPEAPPTPDSTPPSTLVPVPARPARQPRLDTRTAAQRTADEVLDVLSPEVRPVLRAMTWSTWRSRNRQRIVDIAAAGQSADEIIAAWRAGSERRGYPVVRMEWIAEDLERDGREPAPNAPNATDLLPTLTELLESGEIEPWTIPPWKRPPFTPEFKAWRAEHPDALIPA